MKGNNICIFDCNYMIKMAVVLLYIAIIRQNKISTITKLYSNLFTFKSNSNTVLPLLKKLAQL